MPSEKTTKLYWRYLSSNNLLASINEVNLEDEEEVFLLEKATHDQNYDENELFNLYKRFQFSIDQLLNVESDIKNYLRLNLELYYIKEYF